MGRGDVDVDDISQLALIEIVRSFHNYRGEGALHSWADRITTRVALHYLRRRRNEERRRTALSPAELYVISPRSEQPDEYTVLLYSDDPAVRDRIRLAIGVRPAPSPVAVATARYAFSSSYFLTLLPNFSTRTRLRKMRYVSSPSMAPPPPRVRP